MMSKNYLTNFLNTLSGPRVAFLAFAAVGGYFLWTEHQAHLLGALPYLILLLCPLMHIFMHRGHGDHSKHSDNQENHDHHSEGGA